MMNVEIAKIAKNAKNEAMKVLTSEDYTNLFCKSLRNAITSNRLILASTYLSLNAGVSYDDLLNYAKTSCGREWNASNRAFFAQPIRAGRNLFNKYNKDESFFKIANAEGLTLEAKAEALVELLVAKKITVNSLLRPKAEEVKAEEVKAEEVKAEEVKAINCTLIKPQDNMTLEDKIAADLFTLQDKYKHNKDEFILACLSTIEFLANNDFDKMRQYLNQYIELSSNLNKVA